MDLGNFSPRKIKCIRRNPLSKILGVQTSQTRLTWQKKYFNGVDLVNNSTKKELVMLQIKSWNMDFSRSVVRKQLQASLIIYTWQARPTLCHQLNSASLRMKPLKNLILKLMMKTIMYMMGLLCVLHIMMTVWKVHCLVTFSLKKMSMKMRTSITWSMIQVTNNLLSPTNMLMRSPGNSWKIHSMT